MPRSLTRTGAPLPPSVAALDDAVLDELEQAFADARRQQTAALAQSRTDALKILPLPLRIVAGKIIG